LAAVAVVVTACNGENLMQTRNTDEAFALAIKNLCGDDVTYVRAEWAARQLLKAFQVEVNDPAAGERRARRIADLVRSMHVADPRDPRPDHEMVGRHAMFRDHNCSRCKSGERPCVSGNPGQCEWPHARND
jgi:hypothetical protein